MVWLMRLVSITETIFVHVFITISVVSKMNQVMKTKMATSVSTYLLRVLYEMYNVYSRHHLDLHRPMK